MTMNKRNKKCLHKGSCNCSKTVSNMKRSKGLMEPQSRVNRTIYISSGGGGSGTGDMLKVVYDPNNRNSDVYNRANHIGEQPMSTITGLINALNGKANAFSRGNIIQGGGVSISGDLIGRLFGAGDITITATGGGGGSGGIVDRVDGTIGQIEVDLTNPAIPVISLSEDVLLALLKAESALQIETDPTVPSWAKQASKPSYSKSEVGLGNVDNTSDANKPLSTATSTALGNKVDKDGSKQLSDQNFTLEEKQKLAGLEAPNYRGTFDTELAIQAIANPRAGNYALLDEGAGITVVAYFYDATDEAWFPGDSGSTGTLTPAQIKTAYESNPDTNAFTNTEKSKLSGIASGAQVNVKPDWNAVESGNAGILNKPTQFPPTAHTHNASDINSGVLDVARIPVGTAVNSVVQVQSNGKIAPELYDTSSGGIEHGTGATQVRNNGELDSRYKQDQAYNDLHFSETAQNITINNTYLDDIVFLPDGSVINIPTHATSNPFKIKGRLDIIVIGTVSVNAASEVTLLSKGGPGNVSLSGTAVPATLIKMDSNQWFLVY